MECKHCKEQIDDSYVVCPKCQGYLYDFTFSEFGPEQDWVVSSGPKFLALLKLLVPFILLVPCFVMLPRMGIKNEENVPIVIIHVIAFLAVLLHAVMRYIKHTKLRKKNDVISFWKSLDRFPFGFIWLFFSGYLYVAYFQEFDHSSMIMIPAALILHAVGGAALLFPRRLAKRIMKEMPSKLKIEIENIKNPKQSDEKIITSLNAADFGENGTFITEKGLRQSVIAIPVLNLVCSLFSFIAFVLFSKTANQFIELFYGVKLNDTPLLMDIGKYGVGFVFVIAFIAAISALRSILMIEKWFRKADTESKMLSKLNYAWLFVEKMTKFSLVWGCISALSGVLFFIGAFTGHAQSLGGAIFAFILLLLPVAAAYIAKKKATEIVNQVFETMEKKNAAKRIELQ